MSLSLSCFNFTFSFHFHIKLSCSTLPFLFIHCISFLPLSTLSQNLRHCFLIRVAGRGSCLCFLDLITLHTLCFALWVGIRCLILRHWLGTCTVSVVQYCCSLVGTLNRILLLTVELFCILQHIVLAKKGCTIDKTIFYKNVHS